MDYQAECRRIHAVGLEQRAGSYSDGRLVGSLTFWPPGKPHTVVLILPNGVSDDERNKLKLVSLIFRKMGVPAAIFQSDTRNVEMPKFAEYFKFPRAWDIGRQQEEYSRILGDQYDGLMENLPRELWVDAVVTTLRGPKVQLMLVSRYAPDDKDQVVYQEPWETDVAVTNVLPDWWQTRVN